MVLVALLLAVAQAEDKGASITLKAKWNGTSYLMEAAEFLVSIWNNELMLLYVQSNTSSSHDSMHSLHHISVGCPALAMDALSPP